MLIGHMEDLALRAAKTGCAASKFLTPAIEENVRTHFARRHDVTLLFDGGYNGAERKRAVFLNPDWGSSDDIIAALNISYRKQDTLGHRDILGALMALGIERETVGDIITEHPRAAIICLPEISGYIIDNLLKAGRVGLTITRIPLEQLPVKNDICTIKTDTVASLRLDALLSAAFGVSRSRACEMIAIGQVRLNHEICLQPAKELTGGAILSVRGTGRAVLIETGGKSRKGRIFIKLALYKH